jgi:hypothetical protein
MASKSQCDKTAKPMVMICVRETLPRQKACQIDNNIVPIATPNSECETGSVA